MRIAVRVIASDESQARSDLEAALAELCRDQVTLLEAPTSHHRGGFWITLEAPEEQAERLLAALHAAGWLPCY